VKVNVYAKAIVGAVVAGAIAWATARADGASEGSALIQGAVALVVTAATVWGVPNAQELAADLAPVLHTAVPPAVAAALNQPTTTLPQVQR